MNSFDGNSTSIIIALIAILATTIGAVIWIVKYFANTLSSDLREHTKAAIEGNLASQEQTKASKEVLVFMKNLNGKLARATIQTVKEQRVEHQTVKERSDE